jgi:RNA polymerase sigma-70 factor (sigma-E family)
MPTGTATNRGTPEGVSVAADFEAYVAARGAALMRLAHVLTGNDADAQDVVQEALSRALTRWDRVCAAGDVDAYVRRMVVNAHVSWWRKFRRRESPVREVVLPGAGSGADTDVVTRAGQEELWAACARLPRDQRTAVVLRYYEQLSFAEIAALTQVADATARSRVHRGLAALRTAMGTALEGDRDD